MSKRTAILQAVADSLGESMAEHAKADGLTVEALRAKIVADFRKHHYGFSTLEVVEANYCGFDAAAELNRLQADEIKNAVTANIDKRDANAVASAAEAVFSLLTPEGRAALIAKLMGDAAAVVEASAAVVEAEKVVSKAK